MIVNWVPTIAGRSCPTFPRPRCDRISQPRLLRLGGAEGSEPAELAALQGGVRASRAAIEDAQKGHQRPKIEEYGSSLFVVLHLIEPAGPSCRPVRSRSSSGRNTSSRCGAMRSGVHRRAPALRAGAGAAAAWPGLRALRADGQRRRSVFPGLDALTAEIEEIEERIFAGQTTRAQIEALYSLKRKLMTLDHATQPLLEVAGKLHGGRVPPICAGLHDYFRDVYDHLLRLKQSIDNLRDMVATAISVNLSLITIQENEVTKRLAAYAALVAVPTMIAGVYGMNFANMPELQWAYGYPPAVAVNGRDRSVSRLPFQEGQMDVTGGRAVFCQRARSRVADSRAGQVSAREVMAAFLPRSIG